MSLAKQNKNFFQFAAGIFTEGSPLNRPENTTVDEVNFQLLREGYRRRRPGLGLQPNNPTENTSVVTGLYYNDNTKMNVYRWDNVGGDPDKTFHVVKGPYYLTFFEEVNGELIEKLDPVTTFSYYLQLQGDSSTVDWGPGFGTRYLSEGPSVCYPSIAYEHVSMSSGNGFLFVTGKYIKPFYVEYDAINDDFKCRGIDMLERDLEGVDDGLGYDTQPTTDIADHRYNLYNQGWADQTIDGAASAPFEGGWFTKFGRYPSNSMIWYYGKFVEPSNGYEQFSATQLSWQDFGNMPAPRGRFLKRIFEEDSENANRFTTRWTSDVVQLDVNGTTNTVTVTTNEPHGLVPTDGVSFLNANFYLSTDESENRFITGWYIVATTPSTTTFTIAGHDISQGSGTSTWYPYDTCTLIHPSSSISVTNYYQQADDNERFSQCAFHAQRLWLAGNTDAKFGRRLYFSQIIQDYRNISAFYQAADPTSEHISDLVASDGGFISIPEMGQVLKMHSYGHYLIVLADNGVWAVGPGEAGYFTADDYAVMRLAYADVIFPEGAVATEDLFFYWTTAGMFVISAEQITKSPQPQNITEGTIDTLYKDIIANSTAMTAKYDETGKRIYFLYSYEPDETVAQIVKCEHTRALILDVALGAFTRYEFYVPDATFDDFGIIGLTTTKHYLSDSSKVKILSRTPSVSSTRYIYVYEFNNDSTFTDYADFIDYDGDGGVTDCYMTTTYETGQDGARRKFGTYLTTHFNRTETEAVLSGSDLVLSVPSSCMLTAKWNWTDRSTGEKASNAAREIYRLNRYYQPDAVGAWDNGLPVTTTKNKIRGSGKSLQLHFEVPAYHDCQLLGWQLTLSGVTEV